MDILQGELQLGDLTDGRRVRVALASCIIHGCIVHWVLVVASYTVCVKELLSDASSTGWGCEGRDDGGQLLVCRFLRFLVLDEACNDCTHEVGHVWSRSRGSWLWVVAGG